MSQETTDNFWRVWNSFQWPDPKPVFFRLYHDDQGRPVTYSMEELDMPFVEVDQQAYVAADHNVKVVDGKIVRIQQPVLTTKLRPAPHGTPCDVRDVSVVVDPDKEHVCWSKSTYEQN